MGEGEMEEEAEEDLLEPSYISSFFIKCDICPCSVQLNARCIDSHTRDQELRSRDQELRSRDQELRYFLTPHYFEMID